MMSSTPSRRSDTVVLAAALVWMLAFGGHFFAQPISETSEFGRSEILSAAHWLLLDKLAPVEPEADSGWHNFPQRFDLLAVAAGILAGSWALGHLILRVLRPALRSGAEGLVFAGGLGIAGWSLTTLVLGLAGLLFRPLLIALLLAALAGEIGLRIRERMRLPLESRKTHAPLLERRFLSGPRLPLLVSAAVAPFLLAMLLGAMLPPTDFDVKEYHLQGPKEWYLQGRITFLPHNVYTSFPFLTEMLPLMAMVVRADWYRGALAGQVVLMGFAPLTALAIFAAARPLSATAGWLAAGIYLTIPWVYRISVIPYAEGGLTFYLAATFVAWLAVIRETADGPVPWRNVLLCGLLAGSALASKYPGLVSVTIPVGLALLIHALRRETGFDWRRGLWTAAIYSAGVAVTFGPWALKNLVQTGNPVYPLAYSIFGGTDWDPELNVKWKQAHSAPVHLLHEPGRILPDFVRHVMDVAVNSAWQSPLVFGLAPLALIAFWPRSRPDEETSKPVRDRGPRFDPRAARSLTVQLIAYAAWLFLTWWTLTHRIDRFWLPMLPIVCLLGGIGLFLLGRCIEGIAAQGSGATAAAWSLGLILLLAVPVAYNLAFATSPLSGNNTYLADDGAARRDAMSATPSIALLTSRLPGNARVLLVGEAAVFDAPFDHRYNTVFDYSLLQMWTSENGTEMNDPHIPLRPRDEILHELRRHGITHVFINWLEILRYREPGSYGYTEFVSPRTIQKLVELEVLTPVRLSTHERLVPFEQLSPGKQRELKRWGQELLTRHDGDVYAVAYELYTVNPPEGP